MSALRYVKNSSCQSASRSLTLTLASSLQKFDTQLTLPFVFALRLPHVGHKAGAVMKSTFRQSCPPSVNIRKAVELRQSRDSTVKLWPVSITMVTNHIYSISRPGSARPWLIINCNYWSEWMAFLNRWPAAFSHSFPEVLLIWFLREFNILNIISLSLYYLYFLFEFISWGPKTHEQQQ